MHTPVPPIPMLWAQVSAPSLGTKKEQKSTRALCRSSPLPAAGVPAGEGLLTHPVTAAFCPTAGLLLWGAGLPLVEASLFNPQLQKAVCGQKRWLVGASEAPGDGCSGFGWHTGLRRPALGEGAGRNFIVSGRTTSARDERQHFRSPGYVSGAFPG